MFNGGTLQITGNTLTNFSGIGHTVSFTAGKTVGLDINSASNTFTVDQVLNQTTGGFTKTGAGTAILNQANTYTGATTVSGGTLTIASGGSFGNTAVTVGTSAGTLNLNNASAISQNTLQVNTGGTVNATVANAISGSAIVNVNAGTLTLSASNNYSGGGTFQGERHGKPQRGRGARVRHDYFIRHHIECRDRPHRGQRHLEQLLMSSQERNSITGANNVTFSGSLFGQAGTLINSLTTTGGGTITVSNPVYLTATPGTGSSIAFSIGATNNNLTLINGTIYNDNTTNATTGNTLNLGSGTLAGTIRIAGTNNYSGTTSFGGSGNTAVQATNSNAFGTSTLVFNDRRPPGLRGHGDACEYHDRQRQHDFQWSEQPGVKRRLDEFGRQPNIDQQHHGRQLPHPRGVCLSFGSDRHGPHPYDCRHRADKPQWCDRELQRRRRHGGRPDHHKHGHYHSPARNTYSGTTTMNAAGGTLVSSPAPIVRLGATTLTAGTLQLASPTANNGGLASGLLT